MLLTEEQAKDRWCPMVTRALDIDAGHCIASQCVMWRWHEAKWFKEHADKEYARTGKRLTPTEGYCGLAGKQEVA